MLGLKATSVAWSPRAVSPGSTDDWFVEYVHYYKVIPQAITYYQSRLSRLVVSTHDFGLHILSKLPGEEEVVYRFGGGLTGHHARINDLTFVGGQEISGRHVASVSGEPPVDHCYRKFIYERRA